MSQAIRTRSFWLVALAWVLGGLSIGMAPHFVAYLTGIGYTSAAAATVMLLYLVATTVGALLGGRIADGLGARTAFTMTCLMSATGMFALLGAAHLAGVALNIVAGGFAAGAWAVLMPLVLIQSFGMKRFGSVMGWTGVFYTAGAAVGPILTGHIFDVSHSYAPAITMFGIMLIGCAAAIFGTASYEDKEVVVEPAPIAASA
jgi:MFS family permease